MLLNSTARLVLRRGPQPPEAVHRITGDAMLYSMFRLSAEPVSCPFHGPLTFTYSKGYGDCTNPVSQVDSCAEDSRLLFRHQACADVPGSESFEEELVCLGSWKDGSNHYLVGKVNHIHANSDEDRYRCFIYEHPHRQGDTATWNLAQSADATCQGLISAHEGSKTMKLTKVTHSGKKCKLPAWLTAHRHWHTLDYSQSYYVYHKNTSLRISNGTAAPEDLETRGHTDLRLVCYKAPHPNPPLPPDSKSGYQCMRIYRRDDHVVQARVGELAFMAEEACSTHYWSPTSTNLTTLVAAGGPPRSCGTFGRVPVPRPVGGRGRDLRGGVAHLPSVGRPATSVLRLQRGLVAVGHAGPRRQDHAHGSPRHNPPTDFSLPSPPGQCTESMPSVSSGVVGGEASGLLLLLVLLLSANRLSFPPAVSRVAASSL
ncbi:hypothetical protein C7M84_000092 [Penaeus vannamei]|uniref:Uncharacterized protein n=1 Tax=Penaeus vannamei TaxID=6689 RepID=A0A3R7QJV8_PENVA|nr:hypothetical protein C7M84_000092 [Penaeus vannamei]